MALTLSLCFLGDAKNVRRIQFLVWKKHNLNTPKQLLWPQMPRKPAHELGFATQTGPQMAYAPVMRPANNFKLEGQSNPFTSEIFYNSHGVISVENFAISQM